LPKKEDLSWIEVQGELLGMMSNKQLRPQILQELENISNANKNNLWNPNIFCVEVYLECAKKGFLDCLLD